MEMHSRQSLYEIPGLSVERRRRRSRLIGRLLIARIVGYLTKVKRAIETELAIRRAMTELAEMDVLPFDAVGQAQLRKHAGLGQALAGVDLQIGVGA